MNLSAALKIGLLLAMVSLCIILFALGLRLALPRPEWVSIGDLTDFPPATHPYEINSPVHVFVVNDGSQFLVLEPLNQVDSGFKVKWVEQKDAFVDPIRGSWFDLLGQPIRPAGINSIIEGQNLARYAWKIKDSLVWIDYSR